MVDILSKRLFFMDNLLFIAIFVKTDLNTYINQLSVKIYQNAL